MTITVREYREADVSAMNKIWNRVVQDGVAFPQTEFLDLESGRKFFAEQSFTGVAENESGEVVGLYILHPNNIGRCGHICNASYAVDADVRGGGIGERLVRHCVQMGKELGFGVLQFNAVVSTNAPALHLYEKLGFIRLGVIPKGFRLDSGEYADIIPHYISL
ncbi:MAG: GNAT family N-acetyltransferase [Clostridia bacterium]|nr:GNAT family N-acetyltransferase [Clostridia bacterium]